MTSENMTTKAEGVELQSVGSESDLDLPSRSISSEHILSNRGEKEFQNHPMVRAWVRLMTFLNHCCDRFFRMIGMAVGKFPKLSLLLILVCTVAAGYGATMLEKEREYERLYAPQDSTQVEHWEYVEQQSGFGKPSRAESVILYNKHEDGVFTIEAVSELFRVWELITDTLSVNHKGRTYTYEDVCERRLDNNECALRSVLEFWNSNSTIFQNEISSNEQLLTVLSSQILPNGDAFQRYEMFGSVETDSNNRIVSGHVFVLSYLLAAEPEDLMMKFETEIVSALEKHSRKVAKPYHIVFSTTRSIDDAIAESIAADMKLMVLTYVIMIIFVIVTMGKWDWLYFRASTGFLAMLLTIFGIITGYGICGWIGIKMSPIVSILPFVLVGIGVDDMFIISSAFDRSSRALYHHQRAAVGLYDSGVAVTVTSVTDILAFVLGALSRIPAVRAFCIFAAVSVTMIYLYQVIGLTALLVFESKRIKSKRVDCCCCVVLHSRDDPAWDPYTSQQSLDAITEEADDCEAGEGAGPGQTGGSGDGSDEEDLATTAQREENILHSSSSRDGPIQSRPAPFIKQDSTSAASRSYTKTVTPSQHFFKNKCSSFMFHPLTMFMIFLLFVAIALFGGYGASKVEAGFDVRDVCPDDSYVRDYYDIMYGFPDISRPMHIYIKDVDYADPQTLKNIDKHLRQVDASKWISVVDEVWVRDFSTYIASAPAYQGQLTEEGYIDGNKALFYQALNDFLNTEQYRKHVQNIRFWSDPDPDGIRTIRSSRVFCVMQVRPIPQDFQDIVLDTEAIDRKAAINKQYDGTVQFTFAKLFVAWYQYTIITDELVSALILSVVAVSLICMFMLVHPTAAGIIVVLVALIDMELFGSIWYWGLEINSVTALMVIMALGLVVDYNVHMIHAFMEERGSRIERVVNALSKLGASVWFGGLTTLIGVLPLAFAETQMFRVFFRMFLSIILLGIVHGLIILPVILYLIGPQIEKQFIKRKDRSFEVHSRMHLVPKASNKTA